MGGGIGGHWGGLAPGVAWKEIKVLRLLQVGTVSCEIIVTLKFVGVCGQVEDVVTPLRQGRRPILRQRDFLVVRFFLARWRWVEGRSSELMSGSVIWVCDLPVSVIWGQNMGACKLHRGALSTNAYHKKRLWYSGQHSSFPASHGIGRDPSSNLGSRNTEPFIFAFGCILAAGFRGSDFFPLCNCGSQHSLDKDSTGNLHCQMPAKGKNPYSCCLQIMYSFTVVYAYSKPTTAGRRPPRVRS